MITKRKLLENIEHLISGIWETNLEFESMDYYILNKLMLLKQCLLRETRKSQVEDEENGLSYFISDQFLYRDESEHFDDLINIRDQLKDFLENYEELNNDVDLKEYTYNPEDDGNDKKRNVLEEIERIVSKLWEKDLDELTDGYFFMRSLMVIKEYVARSTRKEHIEIVNCLVSDLSSERSFHGSESKYISDVNKIKKILEEYLEEMDEGGGEHNNENS